MVQLMPNPTDWSALGAIIDCEGSILTAIYDAYDGRRRMQVRLAVSMADREIVDWLGATFGGRVSTRSMNGRKALFEWIVDGKGCVPILEGVIPWLRIKKRKGVVALYLASSLSNGSQVGDEVWSQRLAAISLLDTREGQNATEGPERPA